ncbi:branched-chain amino acid ABC transporter permease [Pararhodobacter zhoushanensis]|uniref:Branched-chain amino acid ABC transporter permease n=1 Tax=Pararhodobacter zhoushanensis TaxID=2479545 RepID=A0ABT3GU16_9RHOB|nr:branched-chain amino acid ABC transporter permease [Pararhodobacter zhoushanensis]MCW1931005.1 branched-chain amino acid ABC transporter permease [Pararhodobacter zhoushanensis]
MTRYALFALFAVLAVLAPFQIYPILLMTILCFVVFASSFNLLLGYAGLLCFGHAMFFGTAAYLSGWMLKNTALSIELCFILAALAMAALGWLVGLISARRGGIQFAMITLAISQFVYFLLLRAPFTGGEDGLQRIPRSALFGVVDVSSNLALYFVVLVFSVLAIALFYRIVHSPFGEVLRAIRDNEDRVESLGFQPERFKILALTLSAGLAGLAGAMKAAVFQIATLHDLSFHVSGTIIFMTLLGGLGTMTGPMVGAALIVLLNDELAQFGEWALIIQGTVFLAVILFFRKGVVGEIKARFWKPAKS